MKAWHRFAGAVALVAAVGAVGLARPAAAQRFNVTELGTLRSDGSGSSSALAINASGDVVGYATTDDGGFRAFLWRQGQGIVDLSTLGVKLGGSYSKAWAVSDRDAGGHQRFGGEAETAANPISSSHAFLFGPSMADLNSLGPFLGGQNSVTRGVNTRGQAAGAAQIQGGAWHAFRYDASAGMMDLAPLGGVQSRANGINERGEVVGAADLPNGTTHGVAWTPGTVSTWWLAPTRSSELLAINDKSTVCGWGIDRRNRTRAFTAQVGVNRPSPLNSLRGMTKTQAFAINNDGLVVGCSGRAAPNSRRAVLWQGAAVVDLNTRLPRRSGWILRCAYGINEQGQIVGEGLFQGNTRGFLLTPQ